MKTRTWILLFAAAILICAVSAAFLMNRAPAGDKIGVYQDGEELYIIDLRDVSESYEIELKSDRGVNVLCIEPDGAYIRSADCPDQICVHHEKLTKSAGTPIICLPNRVVVKWIGGGSAADAVVG